MNDFVNLLNMSTEWKPTSEENVFEGCADLASDHRSTMSEGRRD